MWFPEIHDADYPCDYTIDDVAFLDALRGAAQTWPRAMADRTWAWHPFEASELIAVVEPRYDGVDLGTFGVRMLDPGRARADRLHNQLFDLPETPTSLGADITGTPEQVHAMSAAWLGRIINAPVQRLEWWHRGQRYAQRWELSGLDYGLTQQYNRQLAPPGQTERLIDGGHVHGQRWIQSSGLGEPDRVIPLN